MKQMKILGKTIDLNDDYIEIHKLKFLKDNPRVYACTHGEPNFDNEPEEKQQEIIYKKLLEEPSVKKLLPDIKRHGGLMESILIRLDTMDVIEGNSRLAVYRKLHEDPAEDGEWELIPCDMVSSLTDDEQVAFLNQIHVKGKTQWSAFEKANFAYVRKESGWSINKIAELFGESQQTIRTRIDVIRRMKESEDSDRSHFSYYDVIVRNRDISNAIKDGKLPNLLKDIKAQGSAESDDETATNNSEKSPDQSNNKFTALELRKKLPVVLNKPKVLKKYQDREIDLDEAYQRAKISGVEENVKQATALLSDISKADISRLENNAFNRFNPVFRKHKRELERVDKIVKERQESEQK